MRAILLVLLVSTLIASVRSKIASKLYKLPEDDMLLFWKDTKLNTCKPFTTFYVKCNKCVCSADGVQSCTRIICRRFYEEPKPTSDEESDVIDTSSSTKEENNIERIKIRRKNKKRRTMKQTVETQSVDPKSNYNLDDNFINL